MGLNQDTIKRNVRNSRKEWYALFYLSKGASHGSVLHSGALLTHFRKSLIGRSVSRAGGLWNDGLDALRYCSCWKLPFLISCCCYQHLHQQSITWGFDHVALFSHFFLWKSSWKGIMDSMQRERNLEKVLQYINNGSFEHSTDCNEIASGYSAW